MKGSQRRVCGPWHASMPVGVFPKLSIASSWISNEWGFASLEDFLIGFWEGLFLPRDANNLLAMLWTWQHGDISANPTYGGSFEKALSAITCKAIVMPGQTDLYFPPEDNQYEVSHMPNAECRSIPSIWGHIAGGPGVNPDDVRFIDNVLKELLSS
jgi:homoserine O-acetyltransferase